ncbi:hypothetical protein BaRGS_00020015 [Batillaria attramentaria]|uniref:Domain of unknown function with conserved HDNR motif domain-containing protein n=1 Tax=Batillaria attramentaria TaxID=370345 RepID=A0ABD0KNT0_9CAEN
MSSARVQKLATMFRHRGADNSDAGQTRRELTSTGRMLAAPFTEPANTKPNPPPPPFNAKSQTTNPFSLHDNRNSFQGHGVYFGDGSASRPLGRRLHPIQTRLHHTDRDFLMHKSRDPVNFDYRTESATSYTGRPTAEPPTARRFPRSHGDPPSGPQTLNTSTTDWFQPAYSPTTSSTRVLAISQQPYPKHNSWKYSYKPLHKVYPPYDTNRMPLVDNVFNRYGAAFTTGAGS